MPTPPAHDLTAILAEPDAEDLLSRLAHVDARYQGIPFHERPEPLGTFGMCYALHDDVTADGMGKFLAQSEGDGFHETLEACRRVGATRAAALLERVARLYRGGRVPRDATRRYALVERLEAEASDRGTDDQLQQLEAEFADAMPALASAMRSWVTQQRESLEQALDALPGPEASPPSPIQATEAGAATREGSEDAVRRRREEQASFETAARERGLMPWSDRGPDPRYLAFLAAVERFGADEWRQVVRRVLERPRKVDTALQDAIELYGTVEKVNRSIGEAFTRARKRNTEARAAAFATVSALPVQEQMDGRSVGLRAKAHHALVAATLLLGLHDWVLLAPPTIETARLVYALFDGLAPVPELPAAAKGRPARPRRKLG